MHAGSRNCLGKGIDIIYLIAFLQKTNFMMLPFCQKTGLDTAMGADDCKTTTNVTAITFYMSREPNVKFIFWNILSNKLKLAVLKEFNPRTISNLEIKLNFQAP